MSDDRIKKNNLTVSGELGSKFGIFHDLIKFRVREILLVSSYYDAFVLEEDGRLSEKIFGEYIDLNLRFVPRIHRFSTAEDALSAIRSGNFDMVITMTRITDMDPLEFGRKVKAIAADLPVIMLTFEGIEMAVLDRMRRVSSIDKVFYWSGDTRMLLAVIKYVEDLKNAANDVELGVRVILIIEDSPKFYSIFLPIIYTEIMTQTRMLISDGVNDLHRLLRMRARPKILMAETYEEGMSIYRKYRKNMLGVISDVSFPREEKVDKRCGFNFARLVKKDTPDLPFLIQSSNLKNRKTALALGLEFLNKNSANLLQELSQFIKENFGFGDFVFRLTDGREVGRARSFHEFERMIGVIPEESLHFHAERNHISIWLRARTEFETAEMLRPKKVSDFRDSMELRRFIQQTIQRLINKNQYGVILDFEQSLFDSRNSFVRLGNGSLGGKARGLAFINTLLAKTRLREDFPGFNIKTPHTFVICSEVFEDFIKENDLQKFAISTMDNDRIARRFLKADLPESLISDLQVLLRSIAYPLAVRSSSLLEDSQSLPFAGLYATYMLPNNHADPEKRLAQLEQAVKLVYASVFYKSPKEYVRNTSFRIEEEKMAVIIQQVAGSRYNDRFYPTVSGVAQSYNYYPVSYQKPEDGAVELALGLGATIVEGARTYRFSPKYPNMPPPYGSIEELLKKSQNTFFALSLKDPDIEIVRDERHTLQRLGIDEAEADGTLYYTAGTYVPEDGVVRDTLAVRGPRILTFANLLKYRMFPLAPLLKEILRIGCSSFGSHVELEFALDLPENKKEKPEFFILQIRPMVTGRESIEVSLEDNGELPCICRSEKAMGNGLISDIRDLIYLDPKNFDLAASRRIAMQVGEFNHRCAMENRKYILVGFGRWGTNDPWLGVPVEWSQISMARVVVECGRPGFIVEPSQGSHFFHNMISLRMGYFHIKKESEKEFVDWKWLEKIRPVMSTEYVRYLRFDHPLPVKINGRNSTGTICVPQK